MANASELAILKQGSAAWNEWRKENHSGRPDFREADLRGADLSRAKLSLARFRGADLRESDLSSADLTGANLGRANLSGANLTQANLYLTNFGSANLRETNLSYANFTGAFLVGADFTGSHLQFTLLVNNDLRHARGLEAVNHLGPSSVGIDTIQKSRGRIPEKFLRGIGIPESLITSIRSVVWADVAYYSCFISYSTQDQKFADLLYKDLQDFGVRCWFAPHDMSGGKKIHEQLYKAINDSDRLLLILSPASMSSKWVRTEIAAARKREERENRRVFFPIRIVDFETIRRWECFDADIGIDSAAEIREYFIQDFSHWTHPELYQDSIQRLVRDLACENQLDADSASFEPE